MVLKEEQRTVQHLNAIANLSQEHARALSNGEYALGDVDVFSTTYPDIDWIAREVYDTDSLFTEERQGMYRALMKMDIYNIWRVLNHSIELPYATRLFRRTMFGTSTYHLPDFTNLHWDAYALRVGALSYLQMSCLSNVIERDKEEPSKYLSAVNLINMPAGDYDAMKAFTHDYMGVHQVNIDDILRVLYAFTRIHVYDAWLASRYAILGTDLATAKDSNQVVNRVSSVVRKLREAAGYLPAQETLIMDIVGVISERLYACIKKAGTLEELIEYPSGTVQFHSQSPALMEELLLVYRTHGYPNAYIGWRDGVGPRIYVNGGANNA